MMGADLRAQRELLAVWGLVLLAQAALFVAGPEGFGRSSTRVSYDFGIELVRFGWTTVVAALLVQSDSLVGTTAFWMTCPIPRGLRFTAKLLSAVLWLVVAPVVVMAAVLFWLGMSPLDALAGGGLIGLEQAVILAMGVMAALVTANIGQVVVAGIAGVTLVSVFNLLLLPVLTLAWPSVGDTLRGGQPTVYAVAVITGGLAAAAYQYLTLRAWHTVVLVAWSDVKGFTATTGIAPTGVTTTHGVLKVQVPSEFAQRFSVDAAWLDGAELVLVEPRPLGVLTRPLTIDNFILGGSAERRIPNPNPNPEPKPQVPPATPKPPDKSPGIATLQRGYDAGRAGARRSQEITRHTAFPNP
ncbi:MAG: hypothetical protein NT151_02360 [Acidobacteria bacterium]|nr:hypothetical protein [Acidobacteriota bacterium]